MASFDKAIPPGQEGTIRFKVKTGHLRGKVRRSVAVTSNDPENPQTTLTIALNVVGSVNVLPGQRIVLNDRTEAYRQTKLLLRKDETETGTMKISDVTVSSPMLAAVVRPAEEGEDLHPRNIKAQPGDWVLEVSLQKDPPSGIHRESVKFKTGLPREPEITVTATVSIRSFVQVSRRRLILPAPTPGSPARGELIATLRPGFDPEQLEVSVNPPAFQLISESTGPRSLRLEVVLDHPGPRFPYRGTIRFRHGKGTFQVPIQVQRPAGAGGTASPARGK